MSFGSVLKTTFLTLVLCWPMYGASALAPELQQKIDEKKAEIKHWGAAAELVEAVKAFNASPPEYTRNMDQDRWAKLSAADPLIRAIQSSPASKFLKSKKTAWISEAFVSGSNGEAAGFIQKTTYWSHQGMPKHEEPMNGRIFQGELAKDISSGVEEVQIGVPILDGDKVIGSLIIGIAPRKLR